MWTWDRDVHRFMWSQTSWRLARPMSPFSLRSFFFQKRRWCWLSWMERGFRSLCLMSGATFSFDPQSPKVAPTQLPHLSRPLQVYDSGIGISPEGQRKLFNRFSQAWLPQHIHSLSNFSSFILGHSFILMYLVETADFMEDIFLWSALKCICIV